MSTVITNGTVVTVGGVYPADLRIDDGVISAVGRGLAAPQTP